MATDGIRTGVDVLLTERPVDLQSARLGLLMNQASMNRQFRFSCDVITACYPGQLRALFSPQHGFWGEQQANMVESPHEVHPVLGVPIHSLYSETRRPTAEMFAEIDVLVVDLQDVGTRVYTFIWTVQNCLSACADANVEILILDRPNPLGGVACEGAVLNPGFQSFVGGACLPMRHGLTLGEMAVYLNSTQQIGASLTIVPIQNWPRSRLWPETGLSWVPPSPNLPTWQSAVVYPGQVLLEGTSVSEGRGTTTPFEVAGAPYVDPFALNEELNRRELPGVRFRPIQFRPTFDKWAGEVCGGAALQVTDPAVYQPYRTSLELIVGMRRSAPLHFRWLEPPYEYESERMPIDILSGDDRLRTWLDAQGELRPDQIDALCNDGVQTWQAEARKHWLYENE